MKQRQTIRHDYRPLDTRSRFRHRYVGWFAAGLGVPLVTLAFVLPERSPHDADQHDIDPVLSRAIEIATDGPAIGPAAATGSTEVAHTAPEPEAEAGATRLQLTVRSGDSLDRLFRRHELSIADLTAIMKLDDARRHLRLIRPGDELTVHHEDGRIRQLQRPLGIEEALQVERNEEGWTAQRVPIEVERRQVNTEGEIRSSLFGAASEAGISDRTIMNLAAIFGWDIDFVLDIRTGDSFALVYEELWRNGEKVAEGDILAAEFINRGRVFRAVRYTDAEGRTAYFTPDGKAMRKAFLRAPLEFTRISSGFNPNRRHPVLNTIRAHRGVDYAAPTGTPVKAAGDGRISFRGWQNGYGNTVIIQHGDNITTLYAHLSRFNSNFRNGSRVRQGEVIAYVGATGLATGPHLHYEFRRHGVHLDPRRVTLPDAEPVPKQELDTFREQAAPLIAQLDSLREHGDRALLAATVPDDRGDRD